MSEIPCELCLLLSICRHKLFASFVTDCELATNYIKSKNDGNHYADLMKFKDTIEPTKWNFVVVRKADYSIGFILVEDKEPRAEFI